MPRACFAWLGTSERVSAWRMRARRLAHEPPPGMPLLSAAHIHTERRSGPRASAENGLYPELIMKRIKEYLYVIIAAFFFGIMPVLIKNAYHFGANGYNVTFYMALLSIPIYAGILFCTHTSIRLPPRLLGFSLLAGLADVGTFLLLYLSYSYISAGMATMLNFIYPVTIALAMHLLFHEQFGWKKRMALVIYLGGMLCLHIGSLSGKLPGFLLAVCSGLMYTVHAIVLERSGLSEENVYVVGVYKAVTVAAVSGILGLLMDQPMQISGWEAWGAILICTILCRIACNALLMAAIRRLGAFIPSVISTLEPVVAVAADCIVLHERLSLSQGCGMLLILVAVVLITVSNQTAAVPSRTE